MGRGPITEPPIPASFIAASFAVRQDGALIRAASARGDLIGESATYRNGDGLRVRLTVGGKRRTMSAAKAAWIVQLGSHPNGQVTTIGAEDDFRLENLTVVPNCAHRPWEQGGGQASSLERKAEGDRALLAAMADHEGAGLMQLAKLVGIGEGRVSSKLNRLASRGLAQSPMCVPGRSWALTDQGLAVVLAGRLLLDDTDRAILSLIAKGPLRQLELSRRAGVCSFTAKRRFGLLVERGLATVDIARRYSATETGIEALGPDASVVSRWVDPERIKASAAKDVAERTTIPEATAAQRSNAGKMARATAKRNKSIPFNGGGYFERGMAEAS